MNRSLMLGIVGDGGTGKTTLVRGVVRLLGSNGVTPICLDDYHRYNRVERLARGLTDSNPAANDLGLMAEHLAALRAGRTIQKPVYDHRRGVMRPSELVAATGLVIAYGMFTLTPPDLVDLFDLTVYLEPDDDLRHGWRFQRDTQERGYAADQVLALRPANDEDALRYISGQRRHACLVVRFHAPEAHDDHDGEPPQMVDLLLRRSPATALLEPLLSFVERRALPHVQISRGIVDEDGRASDRVRIDAALDQQSYRMLIDILWPPTQGTPALALTQIGVPGVGASRSRSRSHSRSLALVQVIVASLLAHAPR